MIGSLRSGIPDLLSPGARQSSLREQRRLWAVGTKETNEYNWSFTSQKSVEELGVSDATTFLKLTRSEALKTNASIDGAERATAASCARTDRAFPGTGRSPRGGCPHHDGSGAWSRPSFRPRLGWSMRASHISFDLEAYAIVRMREVAGRSYRDTVEQELDEHGRAIAERWGQREGSRLWHARQYFDGEAPVRTRRHDLLFLQRWMPREIQGGSRSLF